MPNKLRPLGICDFCGGSVPHDLWYTWAHEPRLHCSIQCRNTANCQPTAKARGQEKHERYLAGTWQMPQTKLTAEERSAHARAAALARREAQQHISGCGSPAPPKPPLSRARAKRKRRFLYGENITLSEGEAAAYAAYMRELRSRCSPNSALRAAREAAGLTQAELGRHLGISRFHVCHWERYGYRPTDPEVRRKIEELLGDVFT